MRKDYMPSDNTANLSEADFIASHWTRIWEQEGGPQGRVDRVLRQDEYRLIAPHLERLTKAACILDGGCGLGDWVLALDRQGFRTIGLDISDKTIAPVAGSFSRSRVQVW